MNVKFSFDKTAVERRGHRLEDVYRTIKRLFDVHDLPCVFDGGILAFEDKGHGDDFAVMWDIILSLLRSDWFMDCAVVCVWQDEDGEEDILAQAKAVTPGTGCHVCPSALPYFQKMGWILPTRVSCVTPSSSKLPETGWILSARGSTLTPWQRNGEPQLFQ